MHHLQAVMEQMPIVPRSAREAGAACAELAPGHSYRLLGRGTVAEAVAALERELAPAGSTTPADVQRWLALSVEAGFWSGMVPGDVCSEI